MKQPLADRLRRWWRRVTCRHEFMPEGRICFKCCQAERELPA